MVNNEFTSLLEELRKQLLEASIYFDIWQQIWPTAKVIDSINRYRGFFQPTRKALFDQFCIKICNIVSNDRRSPSFNNIFRILYFNPSLAPTIDIRSLRKRLNKHKPILAAIDYYRKTKAAHWDTQLTAQRKPVLYGETRKMLEDLQDIFNAISGAATKKSWSFKPIQHNDPTILFKHLDEIRVIHKKRISKADFTAQP